MDDNYEQMIMELAKGKKNERFYNNDTKHAEIVLRELMKNADQYVYIVCSNMLTNVSNNKEYIDAVDNFLATDEGRTIKIIFTDYKDNSFKKTKIFNVFSKHKEQVSIKALRKEKIRRSDGEPINFTVADDRSYRMEIDVKNKIGFGNFNNRNEALVLKDNFERFYEIPNLQIVNL